ncbi:MAG: hypothetical protein ABJF10_26080 [Chthoniobacter sp.]|uniref:DUF4870 domain-containing protein n=1 Tax=Chthoniobacter sp. TaxID=2510640 RepID=UPI0032A5D2E8
MSDPTVPSSLPPEPASGPAATPPSPPQPAASSAAADATAVQPAAEGTGLQPHLAAALASFFLLIGGVVFLVIEKKDQYVRFYAMQSVFLGGLWIGLSIGLSIAYAILHGVPLVGTLLWLASLFIRIAIFVGWVVLVIKAFSGKEWEIPYLGKLARQQLARTPAAP